MNPNPVDCLYLRHEKELLTAQIRQLRVKPLLVSEWQWLGAPRSSPGLPPATGFDGSGRPPHPQPKIQYYT